MRVAEIRIYPVKALRGAAHAAAVLEPWGLRGDRRWMVVDPEGRFLTQREHAAMALIQAGIDEDRLRLTAPGCEPIVVAPPGPEDETVLVTVWRDSVPARAAGAAADAWSSTALGVPCRLVFMDDPAARVVDPAFGAPGDSVSFADGFPVLLTSTASLVDLNSRLAQPVPMLRFRPNIVIDGAEPWDEDQWRLVRIGAVRLRVAKPCPRCVVTTIDPETGERPDKTEPLRTLALFRRDRDSGGVMFGQNLIPLDTGIVHVGDSVAVLERGPPNVVTEAAA